MACEFCEIIEGKGNAIVLFQNSELVVAIRDHVVTPGQITVMPREHHTILEQISDDLLMKCTAVANKVSIAAFESLGSQGTNIIVKNGIGAGQSVPHFAIEVVPRIENDGLSFEWKPQQVMEDEMEALFASLTEGVKQLVNERAHETAQKVQEGAAAPPEDKDNYLLKSLRKIP